MSLHVCVHLERLEQEDFFRNSYYPKLNSHSLYIPGSRMTLLGCTPILWLASFIYSCLPIKKEWLLAGGNHLWISTEARVALMNKKFYLFLLFFFAYPVAFDTVSNTLSIVDIYFYIVNCSYIFLQWPMHLFNMLHIHCGA